MGLNNVKEADVLIVGAGPTGLALACDLARRGVPTTVVEQADGLFPGSRGKGVQPRTMEVFDDLGIIDAVREHGGPAPTGMVWQDGRPHHEHAIFDASAPPSEAEPYAGPWLLPQWRTQEILHARLERLGGRVVFGAALTGLAQDADGIRAELSDGRTATARYAVAADGGRSTVRGLLGVGMTGESVAPEPMLVADVRIPSLGRDHWHLFPSLALCPLPGTDEFQLVARYDTTQDAPDTSPDGVRAVLAARTHLSPDQLAEVRWASDFRPRAALADRFRDGRVFLAGDAAHIHSPAGGQGLNTSVQDAYNLGWKLGQVLRHGAPKALLDTYEQERRPVAAQMLDLSTRVHRGEQRRGRATRQLGLGYRGGPLSSGAAGALRAGDRAPDGRAPGGRRLFDLFRGPHFTLLAAGRAIPPGPDLPGSVHAHRAPESEAYGEGLFLIRPDGYIGWAGDDPAGLDAFLTRVMRI
ncbi:FAD-dependent monooxygenase [Streptomyces sp. MUM 178J]|uniref:FAD-dependent monooxygenase n=1 Tax=Streptomyces sp. MUM 178J TaxID=2791991 RepID=UPI001F048C54|nr:FAD-dependent monooxygenase [Streptomyces sp. MUM 178J]WRQ81767.1 FAD-dependent monooxygenase [Streptomyces sp. MUM 178J]